MTQNNRTPEKEVKVGRRQKSEGNAFPREEVDRLLVDGEAVNNEDGDPQIYYPSYREIATRFGVAHSLIARFARQHNCLVRRRQLLERTRQLADDKVAELRANTQALSRADQLKMIDRFMLDFEKALADGRVRCDSVSDFNLMCRLKEFLLGGADSRQENTSGMPTLEDLQKRYKEMREEWDQACREGRQNELPEYLYGFDGAARQNAKKGNSSGNENMN